MRKIHAAQDALAATGTIPMMDGAADTPARAISVEPSSSKRKKTLKTYGNSAKRSKTMAFSEDVVRSGFTEAQLSRQSASGDWLPATLRADFAEHNPTMMFSEPSSTVPDNTLSQQRMIQQALETNNSGDALSTQHKSNPTQKSQHTENSEFSIPWSAYDERQQESQRSPSNRRDDATPVPVAGPPLSQSKRSQTFSGRNRSSQTPLRGSHDLDDLGAAAGTPMPQTSSQKSRRTKTASPGSHAKVTSIEPVTLLSEIQVQVDSPIKDRRKRSETVESTKPKRRKASETPKKAEPTSDELWIGLPKEQYKPRASRSRSTKVDNTEYIGNVQQTLKPKSKRQKTQHAPPQDFAEKTPDLQDKPTADNAPPKADKSAKNTTDPLEDEPAAEDNAYDDDKENIAPGTMSPPGSWKIAKKQSRTILAEVIIPAPAEANSKRKRSIEPESLTVNGEVIASPVLKPSPPAPPSTKKQKKTKARRSQTAATPGFTQRRKIFDSDESDTEISPVKSSPTEKDELLASPPKKSKAADMPPPPPPPAAATTETKKKGRGRPRKDGTSKSAGESSSADAATTSRSSTIQNDKSDIPDVVPFMPESLPTAHDDDSGFPDPPVEHNHDHDDDMLETPKKKSFKALPSTPEPTNQAPRAETKTPESKAESKNATAHSPISKGKVPYRVGLSRRSRIAPLLKIVKK